MPTSAIELHHVAACGGVEPQHGGRPAVEFCGTPQVLQRYARPRGQGRRRRWRRRGLRSRSCSLLPPPRLLLELLPLALQRLALSPEGVPRLLNLERFLLPREGLALLLELLPASLRVLHSLRPVGGLAGAAILRVVGGL